MQHPFTLLGAEYISLLEAMVITASALAELEKRAPVILDLAAKEDWAAVLGATGVPKLWAMASFERECSSDYRCSPAQGDRWNEVSHDVPRGLGPYVDWAHAAIAAYRIDRLDEVGKDRWTLARACYEAELFNGFGPRNHGRHTGYLWAGTNIYDGGKYVADGKWDADARDEQLGMVPLMVALLKLDPSLALVDALPAYAPVNIAPPKLPPQGLAPGASTVWLQQRLNALGAMPPLVVDGNYGRKTRNAVAHFQSEYGLNPDGLFGPVTRKTMMGLS